MIQVFHEIGECWALLSFASLMIGSGPYWAGCIGFHSKELCTALWSVWAAWAGQAQYVGGQARLGILVGNQA